MQNGESEVTLILNGNEESKVSERVLGVIRTVKELANKLPSDYKVTYMCNQVEKQVEIGKLLKNNCLRIESVNNFATAAGMASSASGLSCLAVALASLYGL